MRNALDICYTEKARLAGVVKGEPDVNTDLLACIKSVGIDRCAKTVN